MCIYYVIQGGAIEHPHTLRLNSVPLPSGMCNSSTLRESTYSIDLDLFSPLSYLSKGRLPDDHLSRGPEGVPQLLAPLLISLRLLLPEQGAALPF